MSNLFRRHALPRSRRLRSPREFARVYALKQRAGDAHLLVFGARNGLNATRVGLSVSKKHGGAVKRTRLKRLLREAFRLSQHDLPSGWDLILIPRRDHRASLTDYQRSLVHLARKLERRAMH